MISGNFTLTQVMEFDYLNTERLQLRKLTPDIIRHIFTRLPEAEIRSLLGLITDEDYAREKKKSEGGFTTYDRSILHFKLVLKQTGEVIGGCGFHNWYAVHRRAELGYALNSDEHKRKGYMTEAANAVIAYGFGKLNLNRIEATTAPDNIASQALLRRFGFSQEGYFREHMCFEGRSGDSVAFALLRREYEAAAAQLNI